MAIPVTVGALMFPSIESALNFFRDIRDQYADGESISKSHQKYLIDLIAIHHEARYKVGCGIAYFTVELDTVFRKTRHFEIHRKDGSQTDVSFHSAIKGKNRRRDLLEGLRRAIEGQIVSFKSKAFTSDAEMICPLTKESLEYKSCHVDHEVPVTFINLVSKWLKINALDLDGVEITSSEDNQIVSKMINKSQIDSWQKFHKGNAKLRLLSKLGNLSIARLR